MSSLIASTMVGDFELNLSMDNLIYATLLLIFGCSSLIKAETTITVTAPVSPVEEGAILSIHCEVVNLNQNHKVVLYRTRNGVTTTLSYGEGVSHDVDDRVFLAVRQQIEGSTVYFLSIIDVTRDEGGDYFCKVIDVADTTPSKLPVSSISVQVTYFPSDVDPVCLPKEPPVVRIGDVITLNCSSAKAYPVVTMKWTRTSDGISLEATESVVGDSRIYSVLRVQVRGSDNKAVFLCAISSEAYPSRESSATCHVGPLVVIDAQNTDDTGIESEEVINDISIPARPPQIPKHEQEDYFNDLSTQCNDICVTSDTSLLFWVIATCVAGILAFMFLIIGIFLFIKFNRLPSTVDETYITTRQPTDIKIYDELETRRLEHQSMYMALDKARKAELQQGMYPTCES